MLLFGYVCNAVVVASVTDYPEEVFGHVLAVQVHGVDAARKNNLPAMRDGGITITSSIVGERGDCWAMSRYIMLRWG